MDSQSLSDSRAVSQAWEGDPPQVELHCCVMPDTPFHHLTGGGTARQSVGATIELLRRDAANQTGRYYEYVWGFHPEDSSSFEEQADTYVLQDWVVCDPRSGPYEAIVILYYSPLNQAAMEARHFPDDALSDQS